jgi:hypothetical protein
MIDLKKRREFADFLDRLTSRPPNREDWQEFIVQHYEDEELEQLRVDCARLARDTKTPIPQTEAQRSQLREWAIELRSSFLAQPGDSANPHRGGRGSAS